mmetsp:Transcript_3127/g.19290  ORF Transcript_3127/g.19290 Transcript_3127/m.19290 type:complete len:94 (-) Transcript_3127:1761-2042(-)
MEWTARSRHLLEKEAIQRHGPANVQGSGNGDEGANKNFATGKSPEKDTTTYGNRPCRRLFARTRMLHTLRAIALGTPCQRGHLTLKLVDGKKD